VSGRWIKLAGWGDAEGRLLSEAMRSILLGAPGGEGEFKRSKSCIGSASTTHLGHPVPAEQQEAEESGL
jgi:hypothetical protein